MQTIKEMKQKVKEMDTKCKCCRVCNGIACAGQVPGVGGKGYGRSFIRNVEAIERIKIIMDPIMDANEVSTMTTLFNKELSMPIMIAPIAGIKGNYGVDISDEEYNFMVCEGANAQGSFAFTGDGMQLDMFTKPLGAIARFGGVPTIKPWIEEATSLRVKEALATENVFAIATDIDAAGLPFLRTSVTPVKNKSVQDLKELKKEIKNVPFIVKGIMSVKGALKALEAGADAIVVSNHGGRVLDDCQGTMEVLPAIKEALQDKMTILIDGGFHSGVDVFKALALGADGVLIGREAVTAAIANGSDGVSDLLAQLKQELSETMILTGCSNIEEITADCVVK